MRELDPNDSAEHQFDELIIRGLSALIGMTKGGRIPYWLRRRVERAREQEQHEAIVELLELTR